MYPRTFSHMGLSVSDIDAAVKFYQDVFGWYVIMAPITVSKQDSSTGDIPTHVLGEDWVSFRIAHMSTGDKIGVELFEFPNHQSPENSFEYWRAGVFHFCIQAPDIEELVAKVVAHGGKQRMPICEYFPGQKPYRMCYMEDPFGNVFEINTHGYELING